MKIIHIADLHFGKTVHGIGYAESGDQEYWLDGFIKLAKEEKPDAVIISGDLYDRAAPGERAVELCDRLLTGLTDMGVSVFVSAGNHDSGSRLAFCGKLLRKQKLYIAGSLSAELQHYTLYDEYGAVTFWLMPYIFPAAAAEILGDADIKDYDTAVRRMIENQNIDFSERNVISAHQNILANGIPAERGGSETSVGGIGEVSYTVFDGFEYAALGHIHSAQAMGREAVRYAGSPLCYHFSETRRPDKGAVIIELKDKHSAPVIRPVTIAPLHPMREIKGTYAEIENDALTTKNRNEYLRIVLTDRRLSPEITDTLRTAYEGKSSLILDWDSEYTISGETAGNSPEKENGDIVSLFSDFFRLRTGEALGDNESTVITKAAELCEAYSFPDDLTKAAGILLETLRKKEDAE